MNRAINPAFAFALMLLLASPAVHSDGNGAAAIHATNVADMLQRKQEAQLRDQLAKQGRWDEVRELDEAQSRRNQAQINMSLTKINGRLAAVSPVDTPTVDGMGTLCAPIRSASPGNAKNFAAGSSAQNQGTMQVR